MKGHVSFAGLATTMGGDPNFPEPTIDAQGNPQLPPGVQKPSPELRQACGSILNRLPAMDHPRWPEIQAAWNGPYKQFNPSGHLWGA